MSDDVIGWTLVGMDNQLLAVCTACMDADADYQADLYGVAKWAVATGHAKFPAAVGEVLAGHSEARLKCVRCGDPLGR